MNCLSREEMKNAFSFEVCRVLRSFNGPEPGGLELIEKKVERKRLIFLGLCRKPIKLLAWGLLCSWRPQAPSRWGEGTECLLERVLEVQQESELRGPLRSKEIA